MVSRIHFAIVASALLTLNQWAFSQAIDSIREFQSGARVTFNTKGHPKAHGVELTMAYPRSWTAAEGERPHIVQKFSGPKDPVHGFPMVTIFINAMPASFSESDARELFASQDFREALPPNATLLDVRQTEIERIPAGILEYTARAERLGVSALMRIWSVSFIQADALVQVQFAVFSLKSDAAELAEQMAAYKPMFMLMANSIVLPKQWSGPTAASVQNNFPRRTNDASRRSPQRLRDSSIETKPQPDTDLLLSLLVTIVVGFFVTWVIGLIPALLIRYAFLRRPLNRKLAFWVAAGSSAFFWVLFRSINIAAGADRPGTGFAWILVFFVARWILSKESKRPTKSTVQPPASSL
jgi:hypothetical protein